MYKVYILRSLKDDTYYIGVTNDLKKRLKEHNSGYSEYSKIKRPYIVVWYCAFSNKSKAIAFEKYLKQGSGHAFYRKRLV